MRKHSSSASSRSYSSASSDGFIYSPTQEKVPLVSRINNAWRDKEGYYSDSDTEYCRLRRSKARSCAFALRYPIVRLRRILYRWRRVIFRLAILTTLLSLVPLYFWKTRIVPWIEEDRLFRPGLYKQIAFGAQSPADFTRLTQLAHLDPALLRGSSGKRLIFIGDIHGCVEELHALLEAVKFDHRKDHIVHTGDVLAKGPDSIAVLDTLIKFNASGVRGNWEDRVLLALEAPAHFHKSEDLAQPNSGLKDKHRTYLASLPLILSVPRPHDVLMDTAPHSTDITADTSSVRQMPIVKTDIVATSKRNSLRKPHSDAPILVVHAGLVPALPLLHQDPSSIMTMRFIEPKTHFPASRRDSTTAVPWSRAWDWYQNRLRLGLHAPHAVLDPTSRAGNSIEPLNEDDKRESTSDSDSIFSYAKRLPHLTPQQLWRAEVFGAMGLARSLRLVDPVLDSVRRRKAGLSPKAWAAAKAGARLMGIKEPRVKYIEDLGEDGPLPAGEREWWERGEDDDAQDGKVATVDGLDEPTVVVYGHNARQGLSISDWTLGLDSGCVRGGRLTAAILDAKGWRETVSVKCKEYA